MKFYLTFALLILSLDIYTQDNINSIISKTTYNYFTHGNYFLKDTIKPISSIYRTIKDLLKSGYIKNSISSNRIKLTKKEKIIINKNLSEEFIWHEKIDQNCTIISTDKACTIIDSITIISTKLEYKFSRNEILQADYESEKKQLPYIMYISKPVFLRKNKLVLIGFTSIGGGLTGNPCHIIIFKKKNGQFMEFVNIECR